MRRTIRSPGFEGLHLVREPPAEDALLLALGLRVKLELGRRGWNDLRCFFIDIYGIKLPTWKALRKESLKCAPPLRKVRDARI